MAASLHINLHALLPDVASTRDACVRRLIGSLSAHEGIERVSVEEATHHDPARLCIHYDAQVLSLHRLREIVEGLCNGLRCHFGHVRSRLEDLRHARHLNERLGQLTGVIDVEISPDGFICIEFSRDRTSEAAIRAVLERLQASERSQGSHEQQTLGGL